MWDGARGLGDVTGPSDDRGLLDHDGLPRHGRRGAEPAGRPWGGRIPKGVIVGVGVLVVGLFFAHLDMVHPLWILVFAVLSSAAFSAVGIVGGIWADKYDHLAGVQNFLVMPLTFLSGVFYSIHSLPPFWEAVSNYNPVFFMIDGFRYGFHGVSDVSPWHSLAVVLPTSLALCWIALQLIRSGYKLRS